MIELIILKFLLSVSNYTKHRDAIKLKKEDRELLALYKVLDSLHEKYNRDITFQEFRLAVLTEFPEHTELLEQIASTDVGEDMLADMVKQAIERSLAHDLALLSIDVSEGRKPLLDLLNFFPKFEDEQELNEQEEFVTDDIETLYQETKHKPGLRWRLKVLNQALGSLRKGDFGFLFARPETGKTTFLAEECTYMAQQLADDAGPILWFNNEEGGMKVKVRIMQASLGCTNNRLFEDRRRAQEEYMKRTRGKILLKDSATISRREIERICKELKPSLIIFDQIDKIKGFDNDREDLRLGAIYIWARELAKKYCPVIGVCQADVTGENKKYLTMDNVANAKTSKQAEADWILGIGAVHDEGLKYMRYLCVSKNKLTGDDDSIPEMRHGKMEVLIQPDIARYKDIN